MNYFERTKRFFTDKKLQKTILLVEIIIVLLFTQETCLSQGTYHSFVFDDINREYMVYLGSSNPNKECPLIIFLHGYGETPEELLSYSKLDSLAYNTDFILAVPKAIYKAWNSGLGENPKWPTSDADDIGFLNAVIDTMISNYKINLKRIYVCGFSNGGYMTYKLACYSGQRFAAIASVAGVLSVGTSKNCNPTHPLPVLQIHGTADNTVLYSGDKIYQKSVEQTLSIWTSLNGCTKTDTVMLSDKDSRDGSTVEKINYSNCSENNEVILYKINNGLHSWPGAAWWPWEYNRDINASVEILNFFKKHQRSEVVGIQEIFNSDEFCINQIYPNPFDEIITINYSVDRTSFVTIKIYNMLGIEVSELVNEKKNTGKYEVEFSGKYLPTGAYFCRMSNGETCDTKLINLVRM